MDIEKVKTYITAMEGTPNEKMLAEVAMDALTTLDESYAEHQATRERELRRMKAGHLLAESVFAACSGSTTPEAEKCREAVQEYEKTNKEIASLYG